MKKIKTAIVGCGSVSDMYMHSIQEHFSVIELYACSDLAQDRMNAAAAKYGLRPMSFRQILEDPDIQMVINLTSPSGHYPLTKQALEHRKHVYSEKMLAIELEQALELCELARDNHVRLGCAPDTFLGGGLQTARYALDKGLIGRPLSGVISLSRDYRVFGENLTHLFQHGGSIAYDMGCYYLTALCSLLGPVKLVSSLGYNSEQSHTVKRLNSPHFGREIQLEDYNVITATLQFTCGTQVSLHLNSSSVLEDHFHLELYGDQGILRMGDPNTFGGHVTLEKTKNAATVLPFTHGFQDQARGLGAADMAWSILTERPHRASMEMACHVLEIVHGLFLSIRSGQIYEMTTEFVRPEPLPEGYIGNGFWEPLEETALYKN